MFLGLECFLIELTDQGLEQLIELSLLLNDFVKDQLRGVELTLDLADLRLEAVHGLTQTLKLVLLSVISRHLLVLMLLGLWVYESLFL